MTTPKPSQFSASDKPAQQSESSVDEAQPAVDSTSNGGTAATGARARITRSMSAPVIELKAMASKRLAGLMQVLFDKVDDALFDMAENASSNQQQNNFFESMRDVRFKRVDIEKRFLDALQDDFVALFSEERAASQASVDSDSELAGSLGELDSLSLMEDEVVEEMVAVDAMVARCEKAVALPLEALDARFAHLAGIDAEKIHSGERANPLSPRSWCSNFSEASRVLQVDIKARIVIFKWFEKTVLAELPELCKQANEKLMRANVLPNYRPGGQRGGKIESVTSQHAGPGQSTAVDRIGLGNRRVSQQRAQEFNQLLNYMPDYDAGLNALWQAAGGSVVGGQPAGLPTALSGAIHSIASSVGPVVGGDTLYTLLDSLQHHTDLQANIGGDGSQLPSLLRPEAVIANIGSALSAATANGQYSLARQERDVITLVSLLFHFVLEDRGVPEPMRIVISRLQIPVIKLALRDEDFFCSGSHPARRLLNELTQATIGWSETDDYHKDPLYQSICGIVDRVLAEFDQDPAIFSDLLADFKSTLSGEDKRAELRQKRLVDAEMGRDASERARERVAEVIEKKLEAGLPEFVNRMVTMVWNNLLFLAYVQHGENSEPWDEAETALGDLLWTVSPARCKQDRAEILKRLPELLKALRQGFDLVNCNKQESNAFFAELEKLHMEIMQRSEPLVVEERVEPDADLPEQEPAGHEVPAEDHAAEASSEASSDIEQEAGQAAEDPQAEAAPIQPAAIPAEYLAQAEQLAVGQWIEYHHNGSKKRCRLVAILRNNGKRIFVNRSGAKACEFMVPEIAELIRLGEIVLLEDAQLFDKALTSIISGLRKQKNSIVG